MPKLKTLTTEWESSCTFEYPRSITLEGIVYHSILTNRYTLSHYCYTLQEMCFQVQENHSHEEFLFLLSLIPRHHSRSPILSVTSFFHIQSPSVSIAIITSLLLLFTLINTFIVHSISKTLIIAVELS